MTAGTSASTLAIGAANNIKINNNATIILLKPVRPPLATPELDSTYGEVGLVPKIAPTRLAMESAKKALWTFGNVLFS